MDKVSSFFVGNVVGITILVAGVMITAPKKMKETEAIQKQQQQLKDQAALDAAKSNDAMNPTAAADPAASPGVVIAGEEIARGEKISKDQLILNTTGAKSAQDRSGSLHRLSSDNISDIHQVIGKTAKLDIHKGSAITSGTISDPKQE